MQDKIITAFISAVTAAAVCAVMIFVVAPTNSPKSTADGSTSATMDSLEVKSLKVTDQIVFRSPEAKADELLIKSGSIVATNKIIATQVLGTQIAGHVLVGNRLFATPSDLSKPVDTWKMYTEIGANDKTGGELIVRSPNGANIVGKGTKGGNLVYFGFDEKDGFALFAQNNPSDINPNGGRGFFTLQVPKTTPTPETAPADTGVPYADPTKTATPPEIEPKRN